MDETTQWSYYSGVFLSLMSGPHTFHKWCAKLSSDGICKWEARNLPKSYFKRNHLWFCGFHKYDLGHLDIQAIHSSPWLSKQRQKSMMNMMWFGWFTYQNTDQSYFESPLFNLSISHRVPRTGLLSLFLCKYHLLQAVNDSDGSLSLVVTYTDTARLTDTWHAYSETHPPTSIKWLRLVKGNTGEAALRGGYQTLMLPNLPFL